MSEEHEKVVKPEQDTVISVWEHTKNIIDSQMGYIRRGPRELQFGKSGGKEVEL